MSFATYLMHLIFLNMPGPVGSDFILYILPVLSVSILLVSLKIMFYKAPKLKRVK